jgi:hypothetical protein
MTLLNDKGMNLFDKCVFFRNLAIGFWPMISSTRLSQEWQGSAGTGVFRPSYLQAFHMPLTAVKGYGATSVAYWQSLRSLSQHLNGIKGWAEYWRSCRHTCNEIVYSSCRCQVAESVDSEGSTTDPNTLAHCLCSLLLMLHCFIVGPLGWQRSPSRIVSLMSNILDILISVYKDGTQIVAFSQSFRLPKL